MKLFLVNMKTNGVNKNGGSVSLIRSWDTSKVSNQ